MTFWTKKPQRGLVQEGLYTDHAKELILEGEALQQEHGISGEILPGDYIKAMVAAALRSPRMSPQELRLNCLRLADGDAQRAMVLERYVIMGDPRKDIET